MSNLIFLFIVRHLKFLIPLSILEVISLEIGFLDPEINCRIEKSFGKFENRVWTDIDIQLDIKISVDQSCVLTALLYILKTWASYQNRAKIKSHQVTDFPTRHSCSSIAKTLSIEKLLIRDQLRCIEHLGRIEEIA